MDFTVWDVLIGIMSLVIRLLFWPLGFAIKFREFLGTALPYLAIGGTVLIGCTVALGLVGSIVQGALSIVRLVFGIFGPIVEVLLLSPKDSSQRAESPQVGTADDINDLSKVFAAGPEFTRSELTARYRQLLRANHPDMVAHLDPAFQALATKRSQQIIKAYEALIGKRGTKE